ncbi:MAG: L,D-transpeptidase family protein [Anderseniella sp.]
MRVYARSLLVLLMLVSPLMMQSASATGNEAVGKTIETIILNGESNIGSLDDDDRLIQVFTYYSDRSFKPIWVRDDGLKTKGKMLLAFLDTIENHGLQAYKYRLEDIRALVGDTHPRALAELEMLLTSAFIDLGRDLTRGRVLPSTVSKQNDISVTELGAAYLLDGAEQVDDLGPYLEKLMPEDKRYHRLVEALKKYRDIASAGGWPEIPAGKPLKPGDTDVRLPLLRELLVTVGDMDPATRPVDDTYDKTTVAAVRKFQERHGLTDDGVIGATTLEQMNVPVDKRIRQLEVNLERRRWLDREPGGFYVFVNLADQELKVVDNGKTIHTARVVVGKTFHKTPVFTENMTYLVINPYWNVPSSIANAEYLPKLKKDAGYLQRQGIRVLDKSGKEVNPFSVNWSGMSRVPYSLRQDTGEKNALGRIKFMFPNKYNVYIHDTPAKNLFQKDLRVFSHGCMRVQDPAKLAEVILRGQGWTLDKINNQIASNERRIVKLKQSIPVYVTYLTAFANKDGSVNFRRDVYGRDEILAEQLLSGGKYAEADNH